MRIPIYQVDAFTSKLFGGNPAAVCPLPRWLPDAKLQAIAAENNLSETAFFVRKGAAYELRWFTPALEIDLCGHATLATAHVIFGHLGWKKDEIVFRTRKSGVLRTFRKGGRIYLDFPARIPAPVETPAELVKGLGRFPGEVYKGRDYLAVFDKESDIAAMAPNFAELIKLDCIGIIVTARGDRCDFVSRFLAPRAGIAEDPVTGSAHTMLIPYWGERLGKSRMKARQISARKGELDCEWKGDRVLMGGRAVTYMNGTLEI
jgi:PhzF family phenazine biosynthesis protein